MMGVVIVVLTIGALVFGVKYFKPKQGQMGYASDKPKYENQAISSEVQSSASPQYENYPHDGQPHSSSNTGMLNEHSDAMKSTTDSIPYENPDDLQSNRPTDNNPYENPDDLHSNHPTDNNPYENPDDLHSNHPTDNSTDAITSEYLTISESGIVNPSSVTGDPTSSALSSPYEDINDVNNLYDAIDMQDISPTVNPYEKIRN